MASPAYAQSIPYFPEPGTMVASSSDFSPIILQGIKVDPLHPLQLDFLADSGLSKNSEEHFQKESQKLINYFLAALTTPPEDLWVNLSPYEHDRIVADAFGQTDMGRDLLAQDYLLKQLTASLIHPEMELGKAFWEKVYEIIYQSRSSVVDRISQTTNTTTNDERRATIDIIESFNKVWIVPGKAVVHENGDVAFIAESSLKVMLEEDYLAQTSQDRNEKDELSSDTKAILRDMIIPVIEEEVNHGEHFAQLRQIYHSLILATWFKKKLQKTFLGEVYAGRNKIGGIDTQDKNEKQRIYDNYLKAFRKGVFDVVKDDYDPVTQNVTAHKYFSGGMTFSDAAVQKVMLVEQAAPDVLISDAAQMGDGRLKTIQARLDPLKASDKFTGQSSQEFPKTNAPHDAAMLTKEDQEKLDLFGFSELSQFDRLSEAQVNFEETILQLYPSLKSKIISMRTQGRFVKTLFRVLWDLRQAGIQNPLKYAIFFTSIDLYGDGLSLKEDTSFTSHIAVEFRDFIESGWQIDEKLPKYFDIKNTIDSRVKRALLGAYPVLFQIGRNAASDLDKIVDQVAVDQNIKVEKVWGQPFMTARQLIGHKIPAPDGDGQTLGYGAITRMIEQAEAHPYQRHVLMLKNVESIPHEVRMLFNELIDKREITDSNFGTVRLPDNLQIIFTMSEDAYIRDESFFDRMVIKSIPQEVGALSRMRFFKEVFETDSASPGGARIRTNKAGRKILHLFNRHLETDLELSDNLQDVTNENFEERIYRETGLVLTDQTIRMLIAMNESVEKYHEPILRIEGDSGIGKTFVARGFAILRGSEFFSNPISPATDLTDFIGTYDYDEHRNFQYNGETTFKKRLEGGDVVALSELNTLLDQNEQVSLAWWLLKIAETKPDADGYRTITLTEVPVAKGQPYPTIRIHPKTLIVVDTNPAAFTGRGSFPEVFTDETLSAVTLPIATGVRKRFSKELDPIKKAVEMMLKMDWMKDGQRVARGLVQDSDQSPVHKLPFGALLIFPSRFTNEDDEIVRDLPGYGMPQEQKDYIGNNLFVLIVTTATIFYSFAAGYAAEEFGRNEKTVLSLRELKRMCEDILWMVEQGYSYNTALGKAVMTHLVYRWELPEDRQAALDYLKSRFVIEFPEIDVQQFLKDQLLDKGRPVHLRVDKVTNVRELLSDFQNQNSKVELKIIPISPETDRTKLEGGRAPNFEGDSYDVQAGIIGQMVQDALAHPDQEMVYVLENIHLLRPEEAVALNEVLQEGTLFIKGQDTKTKIPSNAHIFAISRNDSEIDWSVAEKSRYVTYNYSPTNNFIGRLESDIGQIFRDFHVRPEASEKIVRTLMNIFRQEWDVLSDRETYANRFSQQMYVKLLKRLRGSLQRIPVDQRNIETLFDSIKKALERTITAAFPEALTQFLLEYSQRRLSLLQNALGAEDIFEASIELTQSVNINDVLNLVRSGRITEAARTFKEVLRHSSREMVAADQLRDGDVVEMPVRVFSVEQDSVNSSNSFMSQDGNVVAYATKDQFLHIISKVGHQFVEQVFDIPRLLKIEMSSDGSLIYVSHRESPGTTNRSFAVFQRTGDGYFQQVLQKELSKGTIKDVTVSPDGRHLGLIVLENNERIVRVFDADDSGGFTQDDISAVRGSLYTDSHLIAVNQDYVILKNDRQITVVERKSGEVYDAFKDKERHVIGDRLDVMFVSEDFRFIALDPGGSQLFVLGREGGGRFQKFLLKSANFVHATPDGRLISICGHDGQKNTSVLWKLQRNTYVKLRDFSSDVKKIILSADGSTIVTVVDKTMDIWRQQSDQTYVSIKNMAFDVEPKWILVSEDGEYISYALNKAVVYCLRRTESGLYEPWLERDLKGLRWVDETFMSSDGQTQAVLTKGYVEINQPVRGVVLNGEVVVPRFDGTSQQFPLADLPTQINRLNVVQSSVVQQSFSALVHDFVMAEADQRPELAAQISQAVGDSPQVTTVSKDSLQLGNVVHGYLPVVENPSEDFVYDSTTGRTYSVEKDLLYVTEQRDGIWLKRNIFGFLYDYKKILVDQKGRVYVLDSMNFFRFKEKADGSLIFDKSAASQQTEEFSEAVVDSDGRIYLGTAQGNIYLVGDEDEFSLHKIGEVQGVVAQLLFDAEGRLYAQTSSSNSLSLYRFSFNQGQWTKAKMGDLTGSLEKIVSDAKDNVYAWTSAGGIEGFDKIDGMQKWVRRTLHTHGVRSLFVDAHQRVYISVDNVVAVMTNPLNDEVKRVVKIFDAKVSRVVFDSSNRMYVGTQDGEVYVLEEGKEGVWTESQLDNVQGQVVSLAFDQSRHLYVGTIEGKVLRWEQTGAAHIWRGLGRFSSGIMAINFDEKDNIHVRLFLGGFGVLAKDNGIFLDKTVYSLSGHRELPQSLLPDQVEKIDQNFSSASENQQHEDRNPAEVGMANFWYELSMARTEEDTREAFLNNVSAVHSFGEKPAVVLSQRKDLKRGDVIHMPVVRQKMPIKSVYHYLKTSYGVLEFGDEEFHYYVSRVVNGLVQWKRVRSVKVNFDRLRDAPRLFGGDRLFIAHDNQILVYRLSGKGISSKPVTMSLSLHEREKIEILQWSEGRLFVMTNFGHLIIFDFSKPGAPQEVFNEYPPISEEEKSYRMHKYFEEDLFVRYLTGRPVLVLQDKKVFWKTSEGVSILEQDAAGKYQLWKTILVRQNINHLLPFDDYLAIATGVVLSIWDLKNEKEILSKSFSEVVNIQSITRYADLLIVRTGSTSPGQKNIFILPFRSKDDFSSELWGPEINPSFAFVDVLDNYLFIGDNAGQNPLVIYQRDHQDVYKKVKTFDSVKGQFLLKNGRLFGLDHRSGDLYMYAQDSSGRWEERFIRNFDREEMFLIRSDFWDFDGRELVIVMNKKLYTIDLEGLGVVINSETCVIEDGQEHDIAKLPEKLEIPVLSQPEDTQEKSVTTFEPQYGQKPFYFVADAGGQVYLNFKGEWVRTRHAVKTESLLGEKQKVFIDGQWRSVAVVPLSSLKRDDGLNQNFEEDDFLVESENLEKIESSILDSLRLGIHVAMEGPPAAGKTSIAKEVARLLNLPQFVLEMHGERELSDVIGSYREDVHGRLRLTARPKEMSKVNVEKVIDENALEVLKQKNILVDDGDDPTIYRWGPDILTMRDLNKYLHELSLPPPQQDAVRSLLHYRQPLFEFLTWGGVFVADEGAIGEAGQGLLSWLSPIIHGDQTVNFYEFPGYPVTFDVHPNFYLIITSNSPEDTPSRNFLKSEISSNIQYLYVEADESPDTLQKVFKHFLRSQQLPPDQQNILAGLSTDFYLKFKNLQKDLIGKDNPDRYYISKREIRRVANQVRRQMVQNPDVDPIYLLYKSMRLVYEAMYSHEGERSQVLDLIHDVVRSRVPNPDFDANEKNPIKMVMNAFKDSYNVESYRQLLEEEIHAKFSTALTAQEAWTLWVTDELLSRNEPVLFISEYGSRINDVMRELAHQRNASFEMVDVAPEHGEFEILGGLLPKENAGPQESKFHFVRGKILKWLLTGDEMQNASGQAHSDVIVWIRNIDQLSEDVRTSLNGLLENGYIDIETDSGRIERFYKPSWVKFVSEMTSDSGADFSSAFFNRWIKVGVSAEKLDALQENLSDVERVLQGRFDLDERESYLLYALFVKLVSKDQNREWGYQNNYRFGVEVLYVLAEAIQLTKETDSEYQNLLQEMAEQNYDPRSSEAFDVEQQALYQKYIQISTDILARETLRIVGARLNPVSLPGTLSDQDVFRTEVVSSFDLEEFPKPVVDFPIVDQRTISPDNRLFYNDKIIASMSAMEQAYQLHRVAALIGETGASKTRLAGQFAETHRMNLYKYQHHDGSQYSDLTIEMYKNEDGNLVKEVKEFYKALKQGNVVIDLDEANAAPYVLWVLEAILRGEDTIYPMFPGEEPFKIGDNVFIVLTMNPDHFDGRSEIPWRLLDRMVQIWVDSPTKEDKVNIIRSAFYGIWTESALQSVVSVIEHKESLPDQLEIIPGQIASAMSEGISGVSSEVDTLMRKGEETFDENDEEPETDEIQDPQDLPPAYGVFSPEIYPNTRYNVYTGFNGQEFTRPTVPDRVVAVQNPTGLNLKDIQKHSDVFTGKYEMSLGSGWQALPSAGAAMQILDVKFFNSQGDLYADLPFEIGKDVADNFYVRLPQQEESLDVIITYQVAVPSQYFGRAVPSSIPFAYHQHIPSDVREAMGLMGLDGSENDFRKILYQMIEYIRDFSLEENSISANQSTWLLNIMHSKAGVCRHRAGAFAIMAWGMGMNAHYVETGPEGHAYAEVYVPGMGWLRIDLGGGGDPMNESLAPLANEQHVSRFSDDFPQPSQYMKDNERYQKRYERAMKRQGIKPQTKQRSGRSGSGGSRAGQGDGGQSFDRANEAHRMLQSWEETRKELEQNVEIKDELGEMFKGGSEDTEIIFQRMLQSIRSGIRMIKQFKKKGLEIDPIAFLLKKEKPFVNKKREVKFQPTAVSVLFDFSGSIGVIRDAVTFAIAALGVNFWQLQRMLPKHFYYDLSYYTDKIFATAVPMGSSITEEQNRQYLINMANQVGNGGNDLLTAMEYKLTNQEGTGFMDSKDALSAKNKYIIVFTDGADAAIDYKTYEATPEFQVVLRKYRDAGIDVIAVGIGEGSKYVQAFKGQGQHYIRIQRDRPYDIAEAMAKIAEYKSRGQGIFPDGDITNLLRIGPQKDAAMLTLLTMLIDQRSVDAPQTTGGVDFKNIQSDLEISGHGQDFDPAGLAQLIDVRDFAGFKPVIVKISSTNLPQLLQTSVSSP